MKKRIIFIDDEESILSGLKRSLRHRRDDWDMDFYTRAQDAIDALAINQYDALVTDMRMPGIDGAKLLDFVAQNHPSLVRIVLSGQSDLSLSSQLTVNAHQYLSKPCKTADLEHALDKPLRFQAGAKNENLSTIIAGLKSIPTLPTKYIEITSALSNGEASIREIGHIIGEDPAMSAKLMQMINSAFFGLGRKLTAPEDAAVYLGMETLRTLVLTVGIFSQISKITADISLEKLWEHSNITGVLAKQILQGIQAEKSAQERGFLAGLLHDIGILILATNLPDKYQQLLVDAKTENISLYAKEREVLGATHAEVGAYLMSLWGFSDDIIDAIAYHHEPMNSPDRSISPLTAVYVANLLAKPYPITEYPCEVAQNDRYLMELDLIGSIPNWKKMAATLSTV
jgi:HD-like signal output (HDOD) protein